jgi:hypothetical protein
MSLGRGRRIGTRVRALVLGVAGLAVSRLMPDVERPIQLKVSLFQPRHKI